MKGEELRKARDKFFEDLKKSKAENRRANKAKTGNTRERTECKDDSDSDEDWWYSSSRKTRDTREADTAECCQEHGDTDTFRVIDNEKGQGFGQITWGASRPLRRCLMLLQLQHGDDAHDVCLKHEGKLLDTNLSAKVETLTKWVWTCW